MSESPDNQPNSPPEAQPEVATRAAGSLDDFVESLRQLFRGQIRRRRVLNAQERWELGDSFAERYPMDENDRSELSEALRRLRRDPEFRGIIPSDKNAMEYRRIAVAFPTMEQRVEINYSVTMAADLVKIGESERSELIQKLIAEGDLTYGRVRDEVKKIRIANGQFELVEPKPKPKPQAEVVSLDEARAKKEADGSDDASLAAEDEDDDADGVDDEPEHKVKRKKSKTKKPKTKKVKDDDLLNSPEAVAQRAKAKKSAKRPKRDQRALTVSHLSSEITDLSEAIVSLSDDIKEADISFLTYDEVEVFCSAVDEMRSALRAIERFNKNIKVKNNRKVM